MSPFPFSPDIDQYSIACDWSAREVHLQVTADTYVEVYGPTGRTRGEGPAGSVVETTVLLFSSMLTQLTVDAFGGEYKVLFKLRRPPEDKVTSRALVWQDDMGRRHQVIGRALPDINKGLVQKTGVVQLTGQPFGNFESCAYESGIAMQSDKNSREYWAHLSCKQGFVCAQATCDAL